MKIFFVLSIFFSLFSESISMTPVDKRDNKGTLLSEVQIKSLKSIPKQISIEVPLLVVHILSDPIVEIVKLPTYRRLIFDGFYVSPVLSISCGSFYKDIEIKSPLFLVANMDDTSFLEAIIHAFRPNKCITFKDVIQKNELEKKFRCLIRKK